MTMTMTVIVTIHFWRGRLCACAAVPNTAFLGRAIAEREREREPEPNGVQLLEASPGKARYKYPLLPIGLTLESSFSFWSNPLWPKYQDHGIAKYYPIV